MPNPLSVVVSNIVYPKPQPDSTSPEGRPGLQFSLSLGSPQDVLAPPDAAKAFAYWVLDRANPAGVPALKFLGHDPNVIPDGIQTFLDDGHILVFSCLALSITDVPQGPLYEFLANHGAGSALKKIEVLNTGFASGVATLCFSYTLVCIPGAGIPAIEDSNHWVAQTWVNARSVCAQGLAQQSNPSQQLYARGQDRWVMAYATDAEVFTGTLSPVVTYGLSTYNPAQNLLVFELIPAADGRYMPVRVS